MWHVAQLRSAPLKLCSSLVIVSAMLFPVSPSAGALEVKWPNSPTLFVRCDPESPEPPKKVEVSSPILIAKSGPYRAWVQVTSTPHGITCFNITNLWLQAGHHEHYLAYTDAPTDPYFSGTGMNLVDWSADGELLLTELWQWDTQPNDGGVDRHILVFQPATGAKYEINFGALMSTHLPGGGYIFLPLKSKGGFVAFLGNHFGYSGILAVVLLVCTSGNVPQRKYRKSFWLTPGDCRMLDSLDPHRAYCASDLCRELRVKYLQIARS
jgi:hypothetical protein